MNESKKEKQVLSTTLDYLENHFLGRATDYAHKEFEKMEEGSTSGVYRGRSNAYEDAARKVSETHKRLLKKWANIQ